MRERTTMVMPVPDLLLVDYLWSAHWFFADENENKYSLHPMYNGHAFKRMFEMLLTFSWPMSASDSDLRNRLYFKLMQ